MRKQVGWYDLVGRGFSTSNVKGFTVPVFADDETEAPTLLRARVWDRILVNQQVMMQSLRMANYLDELMCGDLIEACECTRGVIDDIKSV